MRETYNIFSVCILHFLHLRGSIFSDIFSVSYNFFGILYILKISQFKEEIFDFYGILDFDFSISHDLISRISAHDYR